MVLATGSLATGLLVRTALEIKMKNRRKRRKMRKRRKVLDKVNE